MMRAHAHTHTRLDNNNEGAITHKKIFIFALITATLQADTGIDEMCVFFLKSFECSRIVF